MKLITNIKLMARIFLIFIFWVFCNVSYAQDRLVEVKLNVAGFSSLTGFTESYTYSAAAAYLIEGHYYIKPNLAVGAFYERTPNISIGEGEGLGDFGFSESGEESNTSYGNLNYLQYGVSGKLSTSRKRLFQAYLIAKLYYLERRYSDIDGLDFTIGDSGMAAGIGGGLVLKISRAFGINLFEVGYNHYLSGMNFTKDTFGTGEVHLSAGFVFNFVERK